MATFRFQISLSSHLYKKISQTVPESSLSHKWQHYQCRCLQFGFLSAPGIVYECVGSNYDDPFNKRYQDNTMPGCSHFVSGAARKDLGSDDISDQHRMVDKLQKVKPHPINHRSVSF